MSDRNTNPIPTPEYQSPGHYWIPSFDKYERAKGHGYDIRLEEMGWRCYCAWCKNPYGCKHTDRLQDYLFEQAIIDMVPEVKPLSPAQRFMAEGGSIADLFDYSKQPPPPTHVVTNRSRVAAPR